MKICVINGQVHKGNSYNLGQMLIENISGEKEISEFFLPRDLNHFCIGCYNCLEDEEKCPFYEQKYKLLKAVNEADLLIFTTPTYCLNMSASLKAFFDLTYTNWMPHKPKKQMFSKRAVVVATAAGGGAGRAAKEAKKYLFYWGVPKIYTCGFAVHAKDFAQIKPEKIKKMRKKASKIAAAVSTAKKPKVGIKTRFMFWIMSGMQKKDWGASPAEKKYWQDKGWLEKSRPWKK